MSVNIKTSDGLIRIAGTGGNVVDDTLSSTSTNPVQNRIIKSALDDKAEKNHTHDDIQTEINDLKKSVSDGKTSVADAITAKGIDTATDASWDTIVENLSKISTGTDTTDATAKASYILAPYTAYVGGEKITGTMTNRGVLNWSGSNTTYTVPAGYYSGGTLDSTSSYSNGYSAGKNSASGKSSRGTFSAYIGTVTSATATCGFQPDVIIIIGTTEGSTGTVADVISTVNMLTYISGTTYKSTRICNGNTTIDFNGELSITSTGFTVTNFNATINYSYNASAPYGVVYWYAYKV